MSDYKLVPVEPTIEMAFAGIEVYGNEECADADVHSVWEAMIAAAPAVQGEPECGCCGQTDRCDDDCDAAEQQSDVAQLVEALEAIATWVSHPVATIARKALAAHRQLEGES